MRRLAALLALAVQRPLLVAASSRAVAEAFADAIMIDAKSEVVQTFESNQLIPMACAGATQNGMLVADLDVNRTRFHTGAIKGALVQKFLFALVTQTGPDVYMTYMGFEDGTFIGYYNPGMQIPDSYAFVHSSANGTASRNASRFDFDDTVACRTEFEFCGGLWEAKKPSGKAKAWFKPFNNYDCRTRSWYEGGRTLGAGVSKIYSFFSGGLGMTGYFALPDPSSEFIGVAAWDFRLAEFSNTLKGVANTVNKNEGVSLNLAIMDGARLAHNNTRNLSKPEELRLMATSTDSPLQTPNGGRIAPWNSKDPLVRHAAAALAEQNWPLGVTLIRDHRFIHLSVVELTSDRWRKPNTWFMMMSYEIQCRVGFYESEPDLGCEPCPEGRTTSSDRSSTCDICVVGKYLDERDNNCADCPDHTECETRGVTLRRLPLEAGYMRMHVDSANVEFCDGSYEDSDPGNTKICPGGSDPVNVPCDPDSHRVGPRCKLCDHDYFLRSGKCRKCTSKTFRSATVLVTLFLYCIIFLLLVVWLLNTATLEAQHVKRANKYARLQAKIRTKWRILFVAIQILASMPDIIDVSYPAIYRKIVDNSVGVLTFDVSNIVPLTCLGGQHEGRGAASYKRIVTTSLLPFAIMLIIILYVITVLKLKEKKQRASGRKKSENDWCIPQGDWLSPQSRKSQSAQCETPGKSTPCHERNGKYTHPKGETLSCTENAVPEDNSPSKEDDVPNDVRPALPLTRRITTSSISSPDYVAPNLRQTVAAVAILVSFCLYPAISSSILRIFRICESWDSPDGDGRVAYLRGDYAIKCSGPAYHAFKIYCGFFTVIWVIGVPLAYFVELWRYRCHLDPLVNGAKARMWVDGGLEAVTTAMHIREEDPSISHLGILYGPYEPYYWWWEIVECVRRLVSTAITMLILPGSYAQIFFSILVSLATLKIAAYFEPFFDDSDDTLFEGLAWMVLFSQMIALNFRIHGSSSSRSPLTIAFLVVVLGAIMGGIIFIARDAHREKALLKMLKEDFIAAKKDASRALSVKSILSHDASAKDRRHRLSFSFSSTSKRIDSPNSALSDLPFPMPPLTNTSPKAQIWNQQGMHTPVTSHDSPPAAHDPSISAIDSKRSATSSACLTFDDAEEKDVGSASVDFGEATCHA